MEWIIMIIGGMVLFAWSGVAIMAEHCIAQIFCGLALILPATIGGLLVIIGLIGFVFAPPKHYRTKRRQPLKWINILKWVMTIGGIVVITLSVYTAQYVNINSGEAFNTVNGFFVFVGAVMFAVGMVFWAIPSSQCPNINLNQKKK